ncbi:MAG: transcriptional repressor [Nitrospira sp.]|nr:transcriptional repressor [bacterium]MBL7049556.1 transcriptional repressor [Nitrospira sp.]
MEEYRQLQIKLTPQRIAILDYLKDNKMHPSAEDIYGMVKKKFPTMSFATVYNTLEALRDKGKIRELKLDSTKRRYDPDISNHYHLICTKCNEIRDVYKTLKIDTSNSMFHGYTKLGTNVEFFGLCPKCSINNG